MRRNCPKYPPIRTTPSAKTPCSTSLWSQTTCTDSIEWISLWKDWRRRWTKTALWSHLETSKIRASWAEGGRITPSKEPWTSTRSGSRSSSFSKQFWAPCSKAVACSRMSWVKWSIQCWRRNTNKRWGSWWWVFSKRALRDTRARFKKWIPTRALKPSIWRECFLAWMWFETSFSKRIKSRRDSSTRSRILWRTSD